MHTGVHFTGVRVLCKLTCARTQIRHVLEIPQSLPRGSDVRTRVKVLEYLYSEDFFEYSVLVLEYIAK